MEENNVDKNIETLTKMNELATTPSKEVDAAKLDSERPIKDVEESLSAFTKHTFDIIKEEYNFQKEIETEISQRLQLDTNDGGFTSNQLIALHTNNSVNLNDRISKVLGPTFQLMTSKQQAEIQANATAKAAAEKASVNINMGGSTPGSNEYMKSVNEKASQQTLQGLTQLYNLLGGIDIKQKENIAAEQPKDAN